MKKSFVIALNKFSENEIRNICDFIPSIKNSTLHGVMVDEYLYKPVMDQNVLTDTPDASRMQFEKIREALSNSACELETPAHYVANMEYLIQKSAVRDLFIVGHEFLKNDYDDYHKFLLKLNCLVFIYPEKVRPLNHIVILFDGTMSVIMATKKLVEVMGAHISEMSCSVLSMHNNSRKEISREHVLVDYLLSRFHDVGVLSICEESVFKDVDRLNNIKNGTILLAGSKGSQTILHKRNKEWLQNTCVPFFYMN